MKIIYKNNITDFNWKFLLVFEKMRILNMMKNKSL